MEYYILLFGIGLVFCVSFLIWLSTPHGKKWLRDL